MPGRNDETLKDECGKEALRGVPRGERGSPRAAPKETLAEDGRALEARRARMARS